MPYQSGKPLGVLYYDQAFTIRPVPDKVYEIQFEADVVPSQLLEENSMPTIQQWWPWIAYGAAKLIFEDNMDLDSVQLIMPEYKEQEALVQRATINNRVNSRTETIHAWKKLRCWWLWLAYCRLAILGENNVKCSTEPC